METDTIEPAEVAVSLGAAVERLRRLAAVAFEADARAGLFDTSRDAATHRPDSSP
jgi:hypothetical protein